MRTRKSLAVMLASLVLIDILFLPYFQVVIMPLSLPVVLFYFILDKEFRLRSDHFFIFLLISLAVVLSTFLSARLSGPEYLQENIKRAVQFISSFFYFFFFYHAVLRFGGGVISKYILMFFFLFFAAVSVAFFFNPMGVHSVLALIYGKTVTPVEVVDYHRRFAYFFVDPNTAAYFFILACSPLFLEIKDKVFLFLFILVAIFCIIITQSRGGLVVVSVLAIIALLSSFREMSAKGKLVFFMGLTFLLILGGFALIGSGSYDSSGLYIKFGRVLDLAGYSGGARIDIWSSITSSADPYPLGKGYVIEIDGQVVKPHSDLIRLIYSYGLSVFILFFSLFVYSLIKYPVYVLPAFAAFMANTLIDEQKLFALFLCWVGALSAVQARLKQERKAQLGPMFAK